MNIIPNPGNSRKEKQMNAIAETVLVALGLALTVGAAEPPKPEPRQGNDGTRVAESATPTPGAPVDPARFTPELPPGAPSPKPPPPATWKEPETVEIQWGFDATATGAVTGRVEAWWAAVAKIEPLEEANGLVVLGDHQWREDLGQRKENRRRGLRLTFHGTTGPAPILSLWTSTGNCGFNPGDATRGPVLIPSIGLYITRPGSVPVDKFRESLAAKKRSTVREAVLNAPEWSYASAMTHIFGENAKKLPEFPKPPYEPQMQIDVPEKPLVDQWRLGAWHLKRWCREVADGTWQISIWRFRFAERGGMWDKPGERKDYQTTFDKGHATCIGAESFEIIRAFDVLGGYDNVARGGLNHWLDSKVQIKGNVHGSNFTDFDGIVMGFNPHGLAVGEGERSYDYDLKHSGGHGTIMEAAAHHYRMTGNAEWFLRHVPRLKKACEWTLRQRKAWAPNMPKDAWGYGLQPPTNLGDYGGVAMFYYTDAFYYNGLVAVARIMAELKVEGAEDLLRRAEEYRQDIRAAVERSVARTAVVAVGDGTYRRYVPAAPYSRSANRNDPLNGFLSLAIRDYGVYAPEEPLVREVVDVVEQTFSGSNGITGQTGHEKHPPIHLLNDDIPLFLRSLFLEYAVVIRPWELEPDTPKNRKGPETPVGPAAYEFFEHPGRWAVDKTFEEAVFLQRMRNMLVMELHDALWLARATPRAWLEQGKRISVKNAPTYFGPVAYEIVSDVDNGKITATVEMPSRLPAPDKGGQAGKAPKEVVLRFRHPKAAPIKSVTVNGPSTGSAGSPQAPSTGSGQAGSGQGMPWTEFNEDKETITLKGLTGTVTVTAQY